MSGRSLSNCASPVRALPGFHRLRDGRTLRLLVSRSIPALTDHGCGERGTETVRAARRTLQRDTSRPRAFSASKASRREASSDGGIRFTSQKSAFQPGSSLHTSGD